jgi:tetratricopeptide (TPR) repeat protein
MQPPAPPPLSRPGAWGLAVLLLALALGCTWPALHGGPLWDDDAHLTAPELQSVAGLGRIWFELNATQQYYPVLHSAFWLEHRLWGDSTLGYHLVNVLLHALSAGLLVILLRRFRVPGAALAGLLFVVHPVAVESVAWMSEQKNTLSLALYLLAALAYLRFDAKRGQPGAALAYAAASLLFALALLTKSVTATLPAALLVIAWWQRGRIEWRRDVVPLLPWFAAAVASGLFTAWIERTLIGAEGAAFDLTLVQRTLLAGRIVWFYLGKLLWPSPLMFFYPRWDAAAAAPGWIGFLGAAIAVTVALWRLRNRARGPLAAWLFFTGSLFPALGFFNVYPFVISYVADHFQYLASLGLITAAAAGIAMLHARLPPRGRMAAASASGMLVLSLAALSHQHSRAYTDSRTLYRTTLAQNPGCWIAHNNLGAELLDPKNPAHFAEAVAHFQAALRLKPDYAAAHYNYGNALLSMPGRVNDALAENEAALRLRPDYPEADNNLGNALAQVPGRLADAVAHYQRALQRKPALAETHFNLGNAYLKMPGRLADAAAEFQAVLRLKPDHAAAHSNLGFAWAGLPGKAADAIAEYEAALRLQPDYAEAHYNLANALQKIPGRTADAVAHYEAALRLQPDHAEAHNNLGGLLVELPGRLPEAITHFEAAVRLQPGYAEAHYNLAVALLRVPGRRLEARQHIEAFARLWPDPVKAREILAQFPVPAL